MCISGTGRIQLSRPLFTWFLLYFTLGMGDFRVIKLFPSCPESPSFYSILSSRIYNRVTATALPAFSAYPSGFGRPFFLSPGASSRGNSQFIRQSLFPGLGVKPPTFPAIEQFQTTKVSPFPLHGMCFPWSVP